jgi:GcrA cell cycle regulator
MHMAHCAWGEYHIELLRKLKLAGNTARQIAAHMGITRNAVIGKWARLGRFGVEYDRERDRSTRVRNRIVKRKKLNIAKPKIEKIEKPKIEKIEKPKRTLAPFERTPDELKRPGTIPQEPPTSPNMRPRATGVVNAVIELRVGDCRWPIGDPCNGSFRFCGVQCDLGMSYCTHHQAVATGVGR